jgi:outer membrane protein assembly factor BamB
MDGAGEGSRATRRQVLEATAGALAAGALPGRSSAQQASGPTVYVGSGDETLYAVDAATGSQEWAFTQPGRVSSSPTVADGTVYRVTGRVPRGRSEDTVFRDDKKRSLSDQLTPR